jgi:hypothetical protein
MTTIYSAINSSGQTIFDADSLTALENTFVTDHWNGCQEHEPDIALITRWDGEDEIMLPATLVKNFIKAINERCDYAAYVEEDYLRCRNEQ